MPSRGQPSLLSSGVSALVTWTFDSAPVRSVEKGSLIVGGRESQNHPQKLLAQPCVCGSVPSGPSLGARVAQAGRGAWACLPRPLGLRGVTVLHAHVS